MKSKVNIERVYELLTNADWKVVGGTAVHRGACWKYLSAARPLVNREHITKVVAQNQRYIGITCGAHRPGPELDLCVLEFAKLAILYEALPTNLMCDIIQVELPSDEIQGDVDIAMD